MDVREGLGLLGFALLLVGLSRYAASKGSEFVVPVPLGAEGLSVLLIVILASLAIFSRHL